ncbi:MAG: mechanosensitive ion channel family protein [Bacteroidales bacterium]|nr:mechanosensitive ion channel family protein [Bacteroidales bacterium]
MQGYMDISSNNVAQWLINIIDSFFDLIGVKHGVYLDDAVYFGVIIFVALFIGWIVKIVTLFVVKRLVLTQKFDMGKELLSKKVFTHVSHVIPPLIFLILLPFAFNSVDSIIYVLINNVVKVYFAVTIGVAVCAVLSFLWGNYDNRKNDKNHPLRGVLNVSKGVVWIVIAIVSLSILIGKSPIALLTGLGAFAAALMLIFKDSILGFVAGVQLSQNDMLRVGDWIIVPSTLANGVVEDVSLTVVKVRNWDNTMVMLPPYSLVSTSFQNWRGMSESGVRLMSKSLLIDANSIGECDEGTKRQLFERYPRLATFFMDNVHGVYNGGVTPVNGSADTNLGIFRAYLCDYLKSHGGVSQNWQILVSLNAPDSSGIPLNIYCYINTTDWAAFEAVQSEILEHVVLMAPQFGLSVYNSVAGVDLRNRRL